MKILNRGFEFFLTQSFSKKILRVKSYLTK